MLEAVNKNVPFTKGKYNLLRVVAAFPLETNFNSRRTRVQRARYAKTHPLAKLPMSFLILALATCHLGKSIVDQLAGSLERARAVLEEDEAEDQRPKAKIMGGPENRVSNL